MKMVIREQEDRTWKGWWEDSPTEVIYSKTDFEVIGKLCCVRKDHFSIHIEWQDPVGRVYRLSEEDENRINSLLAGRKEQQ